MTSPSKNKGNTWEREVAVDLSKLFNATFVRTPASGAYTGGSNSYRLDTLDADTARQFKGDIIVPRGFARLNIECKNYASMQWHRVINDLPVPQLNKWVDQLVTSSAANDLMVLCVKITRQGTYTVVPLSEQLVCARSITVTTPHGVWAIQPYHQWWHQHRDAIIARSRL